MQLMDLRINLIVRGCAKCNMTDAPRRPLVLYAGTCAADANDDRVEAIACRRPERNESSVFGFRVDLGDAGQTLPHPPLFETILEVEQSHFGVSLAGLIANPEVADVGAIDDDRGPSIGYVNGTEWARSLVEVVRKHGYDEAAHPSPPIPNENVDRLHTHVAAADARFAPSRFPPLTLPPKRAVQVWRKLPAAVEERPDLVAALVKHFLASGGSAVAAYVSPESALRLSLDPALRPLVRSGELVFVKWPGVAQPAGYSEHDRLYFNAHAHLSMWGRNAVVLLTDAYDVVALPSLASSANGTAADARWHEIVAETHKRVASALPRFSQSKRCPAGTGGFWATAGASSLDDLRRWGARRKGAPPLCTPGEGLRPPTPRQARLAKVLAFEGCMHDRVRSAVWSRGMVYEVLAQAPRCAQVVGHSLYLADVAEEAGAADAVGRLVVTRAAARVPARMRSIPAVVQRRPFFDPDAVLPPERDSAVECLGRRAHPWGTPPPEGCGPQQPMQRRDGVWDLVSLGYPNNSTGRSTRPPPIRSPCRLVAPCGDAPPECVQLRHLADLAGLGKVERDAIARNQTSTEDADWTWVWRRRDTATRKGL